MTAFAKLVVKIALSLTAFALLGALIADNHGLNAVAGAAIGGVVGIFFGLVADGEIGGGKVVNALFPCVNDENEKQR